MVRLPGIGTAASDSRSLLPLAVRLVDPGALPAARERYLSGSALEGMSAVRASDLLGQPDLRLGLPRRGTWYYDLGPSQHRLTIRRGRVSAVADVSSPEYAGAFMGPGGRPAVSALPDAPLPPASSGTGGIAVRWALSQLGTPYVWGGEAPGGFDCSGLVRWAYRQAGLLVPRVAENQAEAGYGVARADLLPGDVVFFADATGYIHHDGMYIGDGRFVHAPHTGDVVRIGSLDDPHYASEFAGARRYVRAA
jgi:hypothetical protein